MRKFITSAVAALALLALTVPAAAAASAASADGQYPAGQISSQPVIPSSTNKQPLPDCPDTATLTVLADGCQIVGTQEVLDSSAVSFLTSAIYVLADYFLNERHHAQVAADKAAATIAAQQQVIERKTARIARLRAKLARLR